MSEPWRDALFASDGTEPSPPVPARSGDAAPVLPPFTLPPAPRIGMTREEVAALLRDDHDRSAGPDQVAAPAPAPSAPAPRAAQPHSPQPHSPQPSPPQAGATATQPVPAAAPPRPTRPVISAAPLPDQRRSRALDALSLARRAVPGSSRLLQRSNPRRQAGGLSGGVQSRAGSDGGASAFFITMFIIFAVLLYFIVDGIVAAFARLIP